MRHCRFAVSSAVLALVLAGRAGAQEVDTTLPPTPPPAVTPAPAEARAGPPQFIGDVASVVVNATQVDLIADLIYDDNVSRSSGALAAARGLKPSDVIFEPTVAVNLGRVFGRESAFLKGTLGYDFYDRNSRLNRENIDVSGGVNGQFLRCQESVTASYDRYQSDLADQTLGLVNNTRQNVTVGGSVGCGRAIGLAPSASITQTWSTNSDAFERTVDSNVLTATGSLSYRRPSFGSITLFGSYTDAAFPNLPLPGLGPIQDYGYNVYAGGVTLSRHLGGRIEGTASVSYTSLDSNAPGAGAFSSVTYSGDVIYHATSRLYAEASISRATVPSNRIGANFSVNQNYGLDFNYLASSRLSFTLSGTRQSSNYNVVATGPAFDLSRETTYTVSGTANYRLNRLLALSLNVAEIERAANFVGLGYSDQRVTLGATSSF